MSASAPALDSSATPDTAVGAAPLSPRGPLSAAVLNRLTDAAHAGVRHGVPLAVQAADAVDAADEIVRDDDVQFALFLLYSSAYGSLPQLDAELEWDAELIEARRVLEAAFESELRATVPVPELPEPTVDAVGRALFALAAADSGPSLSRYIARKATAEQATEMLIQRSAYTLREADPHSWAIPRLTGRAKAALVEIQSDEYGGGRPERVHQHLFAEAMRAAGLDDTYGAYLDRLPAITFASFNLMSLFGLNRRLVGAIVGHLAAYEMTSSIPCRLYADGLRRLGFDQAVVEYFDEHVEADAVHEQIAGRDLAGALAEDRPELLADIVFGAAACLTVDGWMGGHVLDAWTAGTSSLRGGNGSVAPAKATAPSPAEVVR